MYKRLEIRLLYILVIFMIISIMLINSSSMFTSINNLTLKQIIWYMIGFSIIPVINHVKIRKYTYLNFYLFNLLLLVIVLLFGENINGSKCWLVIPYFGSFQPSEFMKIALILLSSQVTNNFFKNKQITTISEIKYLFLILLIFMPPTILTFLEPDTGAIIIYFIIAITILFMSPIRKRWWVILGIILLIVISTFIYIFISNKELFINIFSEDIFYRINRVLDWKNKSSMQLENSLVAIGSAGLFGHGYLKTPIYFPESSTDFIFAHLVSNFGCIISILFIMLLIIFDMTLVKLANKAKNYELKLIIISTLLIILFGQIQNISMTLGILPIIGIPLPFISYGGSSLLSYFIIISIIIKRK